jgi:GntR family transcriptional regulator, carbon starvation induced regulator
MPSIKARRTADLGLTLRAMDARIAKSAKPKQGETTTPAGAVDLAEAASSDVAELVDRLRDDIVTARYRADEPLRFRALATVYGASVSTLREALARLAGECLVDFQINHGFRVAPASIEDLIDIMHARSEIEGVALRQSIECGDDEWEAGIVAAHHKLTRTQARLKKHGSTAVAAEWEARHREFHQAMISGCHSRWLIKFCDTLRVQCDRYRHLVRVPPGAYAGLVAQHGPLMDATLARDADKACRLLAVHFENTSKTMMAAFTKAKGRTNPSKEKLPRDPSDKASPSLGLPSGR